MPWAQAQPLPPPLIFVTHAKAGSTWVDGILRQLYGAAVAPRVWPPPEHFDLKTYPIWSAMFMTREEYERHPELRAVDRFVVIRDLRDTLVSNYFSLRYSHTLDAGGIIARRRDRLVALDFEDGLRFLMDEVVEGHASIQRSWLGSDVIRLRYEDLLREDVALFQWLLIQTFGHKLTAAQVASVVEDRRFERVFQRKLGQVDPASHGRQGEPGDWRRQFTPAIKRSFAERFGALLVATGYEDDQAWVEAEDPVDQRSSGS